MRSGGKLFIAIYNDTGSQTQRWKWIKKTYNQLPRPLRVPFTIAVLAPGEVNSIVKHPLTLRLGDYIRLWTRYENRRDMSRWRDIVDWVAVCRMKPRRPTRFSISIGRGFQLTKILCKNSLGCNEFVFQLLEVECPQSR